MLVVADSSPLIVLINIGHIEILPRLFGTVLIPPAISSELRNEKRPKAIRSFIENPPAWLIEQSPRTNEEIPLLDPGEVAAINLALEIRADLLLIDESMGRKAAIARSDSRFRTYQRIRFLDFPRTPGCGLKLHLERTKTK
jgi:predicted nucleic acid-binding protein